MIVKYYKTNNLAKAIATLIAKRLNCESHPFTKKDQEMLNDIYNGFPVANLEDGILICANTYYLILLNHDKNNVYDCVEVYQGMRNRIDQGTVNLADPNFAEIIKHHIDRLNRKHIVAEIMLHLVSEPAAISAIIVTVIITCLTMAVMKVVFMTALATGLVVSAFHQLYLMSQSQKYL